MGLVVRSPDRDLPFAALFSLSLSLSSMTAESCLIGLVNNTLDSSSGSFSSSSSSSGGSSAPIASVVSIDIAPGSSSQVYVKLGTPYLRCLDGQIFTVDAPCELGAVASDPADSSIQSRVLICPPPDCYATGCVGHRLIDKQPIACGVDTANADIGTTYELAFVVYDSKGNAYTVTRLISVVSPCSANQFFCSGSCSNVSALLEIEIMHLPHS